MFAVVFYDDEKHLVGKKKRKENSLPPRNLHMSFAFLFVFLLLLLLFVFLEYLGEHDGAAVSVALESGRFDHRAVVA